MSLSPQDMFECEYIHKHMRKDVYEEAKESLQENRTDGSYRDEHVAYAFEKWSQGLEW